uniref:chalcone synthase n=1 Tax=Pogostemon cablin TaxID=28511 RepID=A0A0C5CK32_POGCB|nr:chalcone synthase-like protein [Pogostemon cablin]
MGIVEDIRAAQRANGTATVLAIGTAVPSHYVEQDTFADYYFRVTKSEHMTELKNKFKKICEKTQIKKRHTHVTEEILQKHPTIGTFSSPSLDIRQDIVVVEVPKLGQEAAEKAISEWGRPKSEITHLIFATSTVIDMPGPDFHLFNLLALKPTTKRFILFNQGCGAGGSALRLAKDLAENNAGARVLVVCSEVNLSDFRGPTQDIGLLVTQALFGDGAAAAVVGADPVPGVERPIFELVSAKQSLIPNSGGLAVGKWKEAGLYLDVKRDIPVVSAEQIEKTIKETFAPLGVSDWNSIFWIVHPGGPAVLDRVEAKMSLKPEKLRAARKMLSEYGNTSSPSTLFVMDEMRKFSAKYGLRTTGEGLDWGVLCGIGPGLFIETIVLRSFPAN